jgi:hypothetical protein
MILPIAENAFAYDRNQATSQSDDCGNGQVPSNVGCQNIGSSIQGDENSVAITGQQQVPFSSPPIGGEPRAHLEVRQAIGTRVDTLNPGQTGFALATCGSDEVITGGGYAISSPSGRISIDLNGVNQHGWQVRGTNIGGSGFSLSAIAECARLVDAPGKVLVGRQVLSEEVTPGNTGAEAFARCNSDEVDTGGGWLLSGAPNVARIYVIQSLSHEPAPGWSVFGYGSPFQALAECAKVVNTGDTEIPGAVPDRLEVSRAGSAFVRINPSAVVHVVAQCGNDEVVTGGGFLLSGTVSILSQKADAGNHAWTVDAVNTGSTRAAITAHAECAKLV